MSTTFFHVRSNHERGITTIEILVAVTIVVLIAALVLAAFSDFRSRQTLGAVVEKTLAAFSAAHLDTISSKNDATYGVYLKSGEVIYFQGVTYPGDNDTGNTHYTFPKVIEIANISLNGGGSTVFYKRLSGATGNYGTFDVRVIGNPGTKTTITVNQTGATSI
jgi:Tfp pilus assembly protein FimT